MEDTISKLNRLSDEKLAEVNDFIDFLVSKMDDRIMQENLQNLSAQSRAFDFLDQEEDLYTVNDLKERYK